MEDKTKYAAIAIGAIILLIIGVVVLSIFGVIDLSSIQLGGGAGGTIGGGGSSAAKQGNPWFLLIPILLIGGPLGGLGYWLYRRRGTGRVAVPPGVPPLPPVIPPGAGSTKTQVAPHNWPDAIDHLAESHADSALIEGRAAITLMMQAAKYQKAGPLESFSGLFGNFHHTTKRAVVLFAIPFPVFFADHKSVDADWSLFADVKKLAAAEFIYGNKAAVDALLDAYERKFKSYRIGHPPNIIIEDLIRHKGLFNPITKKHLSKIANYLAGFESGKIIPVGWYHNHPLYPAFPSAYIDLLVSPSGSDPSDIYYRKGDLACQCLFQDKWSGNNPLSALVATRVRRPNKVANVLEEDISFKIWKSTGCTSTAASGVTSSGFVDVKYKIFCMDEESYNWYVEHANLLIENGTVLKWYETYYNDFVRPREERREERENEEEEEEE